MMLEKARMLKLKPFSLSFQALFRPYQFPKPHGDPLENLGDRWERLGDRWKGLGDA
jgi:hypothetical protein